MRIVVALTAGALFALGLVLGGMTLPARVTGFLDVGGAWDPTLAFVMAGAMLVHAPIARLARSRRAPMFDSRFHWPTQRGIEPRLVLGAAMFGVGWGLSGYCPGPALVGVVAGAPATSVFVVAMIVGIAIGRAIPARKTAEPRNRGDGGWGSTRGWS